MMKKVILFAAILTVVFMSVAPMSASNNKHEFHVAWQSTITGAKGHESLMSANSAGYSSTVGMRRGDMVEYHLPEWKLGKTKKGKIERINGDYTLIADGYFMGVSCVTKHYKKQ